jgi:hypothetical protein
VRSRMISTAARNGGSQSGTTLPLSRRCLASIWARPASPRRSGFRSP